MEMNLLFSFMYNILNVILDKWQFSLIAIHNQSLLDNGDQFVNDLSLIFVRLFYIALTGCFRTNIICDRWNNASMKLVRHAHPTVWRDIDSLSKDQALFTAALFCDRRGDTTAKLPKTAHSYPACQTSQTLFRQEPSYQDNSQDHCICWK